MQVRSFCLTSGCFTHPNEMKLGMGAFLDITQRLNTLLPKKRHLVKSLFSNRSAKKDAGEAGIQIGPSNLASRLMLRPRNFHISEFY